MRTNEKQKLITLENRELINTILDGLVAGTSDSHSNFIESCILQRLLSQDRCVTGILTRVFLRTLSVPEALREYFSLAAEYGENPYRLHSNIDVVKFARDFCSNTRPELKQAWVIGTYDGSYLVTELELFIRGLERKMEEIEECCRLREMIVMDSSFHCLDSFKLIPIADADTCKILISRTKALYQKYHNDVKTITFWEPYDLLIDAWGLMYGHPSTYKILAELMKLHPGASASASELERLRNALVYAVDGIAS